MYAYSFFAAPVFSRKTKQNSKGITFIAFYVFFLFLGARHVFFCMFSVAGPPDTIQAVSRNFVTAAGPDVEAITSKTSSIQSHTKTKQCQTHLNKYTPLYE